MTSHTAYDVLIIGSGIAGLCVATKLNKSLNVALLSKDILAEGSSRYAQGGVAAVMDKDQDSEESHIEDTLIAGAGLCERSAIEFTVNNARQSIDWLLTRGVEFDSFIAKDGRLTFHLAKEGGHSHRRILHSADKTGQALTAALASEIKQMNVDVLEHHNAIDLIVDRTIADAPRCLGAYVLDNKTQVIKTISARIVVLATGGASKVYLYTSNPDVSSGDGIAMAWRAGCRVANMEFNQFHPTCLYHPHAKSFLISEALRGEGATLQLPDGEKFMSRFDHRAELAPRDIVARAIDHEMKRLGLSHLYLDISHKPAHYIEKRFPSIFNRCLSFGIDIREERIPIVPAAHYTCGGVMSNQQGQTDIDNLYAIGEVAYTGLHGANRMASNSLLECLVYADSASRHINENVTRYPLNSMVANWDESRVIDSDEAVVVSHNWNELRHLMWDYVGIVRSDKRLERAKRRIDMLHQEIHEYYASFKINRDLIELRNLVLVADLIIRSALSRKESRGLHYMIDYPHASAAYAQKTILTPR